MKKLYDKRKVIRNVFFALAISCIYLLGKAYQQKDQLTKRILQEPASLTAKK